MVKININYVHVLKLTDGWVVRSENKTLSEKPYPTKSEAKEVGIRFAREGKGQLVIHDKYGKVQKRELFNSEPLPPAKPREVLSWGLDDKNQAKKISKAVKSVSSSKK